MPVCPTEYPCTSAGTNTATIIRNATANAPRRVVPTSAGITRSAKATKNPTYACDGSGASNHPKYPADCWMNSGVRRSITAKPRRKPAPTSGASDLSAWCDRLPPKSVHQTENRPATATAPMAQ